MSTQFRQTRTDDIRQADMSEFDHITDADIASALRTTETPEAKESFLNLPTLAGVSTLAVGLAYMLSYFGIHLLPFGIGGLVTSMTLISGFLIVLFGMGILSWKPKKNKDKTIGKQQIPGSMAGYGTMTANGNKKLMRSMSNKKVSGVCAGIANYFNLDPTLVRVAFVLSMFIFQGFPLLAYGIMSAVLPKEPLLPFTPNRNTPPSDPMDNDRIRITRD